MDFQRIELAGAVGSKEELEVDFKKVKQIKNRMKKTDWLFLNACVGHRSPIPVTYPNSSHEPHQRRSQRDVKVSA